MLLSIIVYTSLAGVLFLLAWRVNAREQVELARGGAGIPFRHSREMIASVLLLAVVAGARYHTGYDHEAYLNNYLMLRDTGDFMRHNYEPGYVIISRAFAAVGAHYFFFFAFWALLQFGLLYYGMRHHKFLLPWLAAYLVLGPYFLHLMNTMRQGIVECAIVAMVPLIVQRRHWLFILCTLALTTLHTTALLAIPIYLLCQIPRPNLTRRWHLAIFVICVAIGFTPQWVALLDSIMQFVYKLFPYHQAEIQHLSVSSSIGPLSVLNIIVPIAFILCYPALKKYHHNDPFLKTIYVIAFIGVCASALLVNTSIQIQRPVEVMMVMVNVMNAYVLHYLWKKKRKSWFVAHAAVSFCYIYLVIIKIMLVPATPQLTCYLFNTQLIAN